MSNKNRGWKPWAREFKNQIFGPKPRRKSDPNRAFKRKVAQTRYNTEKRFNDVKREVRRRGWL